MTRNILGTTQVAGPALQFSLLIVPMVMSCFYLVYSLTGWVIDGRDLFNWSVEAPTVGLWVAAGMTAYCVLVIAFVRLRGGKWSHPLTVSSIGHLVLTLLLTVSIFITVKL